MKWIPESGMWLTYLRLDTTADSLGYDLAIDASGSGQPSPVDAGLVEPGESYVPGSSDTWILAGGLALLAVLLGLAWVDRRAARIAV